MNFGAIEMPQLNKYSLDSLNFPRGTLVFLQGLVFFLGSTKQDKAMKIGFTFLWAKMDLLCISKVSLLFLCIFNLVEKRLHAWRWLCGDRGCGADVANRWQHVADTWLLTGHNLKRFGWMNLGRWIWIWRSESLGAFPFAGKQRRDGAGRWTVTRLTGEARRSAT